VSAPFVPALDTFEGGQMTDLPSFTPLSFEGSELFEIVSGNPLPTTSNNAVNYSITSALLAALVLKFVATPVIITQGQYTNPASPYLVPASVGRIYVNKGTPEPTYIKLAAVAGYTLEPLISDIAGTVDAAGNGIFVTFSSGQLADGLSTVPITTGYAGYFFRPVIALNSWHLGTG
jgi:hypothetical protein